MCERKSTSHVEAITCETSAEAQKQPFTNTSVLQEKTEDTQHQSLEVRVQQQYNTVSFTHSNSVFVVNIPLIAAQR